MLMFQRLQREVFNFFPWRVNSSPPGTALGWGFSFTFTYKKRKSQKCVLFTFTLVINIQICRATPTLRLSIRDFDAIVMAEAGGKDIVGEEL